jgi:hypothetical protein
MSLWHVNQANCSSAPGETGAGLGIGWTSDSRRHKDGDWAARQESHAQGVVERPVDSICDGCHGNPQTSGSSYSTTECSSREFTFNARSLSVEAVKREEESLVERITNGRAGITQRNDAFRKPLPEIQNTSAQTFD